MLLHSHPGAPNPRRVHIYLAEKGIEVPLRELDVMKGESRAPEFLEKINPMGGVPVLELDDGTPIAESIAICRYFEVKQPDPPLFGVSALEQAAVEMWIRRSELGLMVPVSQAWLHGSPLTKRAGREQIPEVAEQGRSAVRRHFEFLDRHLDETEFLAGDFFSMADIVALTTMDFAAQLNDLPHSEDQTHLSRWHRAVSERPSAKA